MLSPMLSLPIWGQFRQEAGNNSAILDPTSRTIEDSAGLLVPSVGSESPMLQTQTAVSALHFSSSVGSSERLSIRDSPILRLPVEITLIIFQHCSSDIKARLRLSHTCQHWMSIASETSALWTDVQIVVRHPAEDILFENLISLLEIQFDRAAGMPLDVVWFSSLSSAFDPRLINLLRRKAPFSRWRTLQIWFRAVHPDDANVFHPEDAFDNLESISIFPSVMTSVIIVLNRTTTSKLQTLDHHLTRSSDDVTISDCTDMMRRISHLKSRAPSIGTLSSNITRLDTPYHASHPFPHLMTYNARECVFTPDSPIDLRHLKTLNIAATLFIHPGAEVSLPSRRRLTCGTIYLKGAAKISTPLLESMHISRHRVNDFNQKWTDSVVEAIKNDSFVFSPSYSLTVEATLPLDSILKLLEHAPRVEKVSLGFGDEGCAVQVLKRIEEASLELDSKAVGLCERLKELRLTFLWEKCDVESWKERAGGAVKNRMGNGIALRIYGMWKGEGAYVLLA